MIINIVLSFFPLMVSAVPVSSPFIYCVFVFEDYTTDTTLYYFNSISTFPGASDWGSVRPPPRKTYQGPGSPGSSLPSGGAAAAWPLPAAWTTAGPPAHASQPALCLVSARGQSNALACADEPLPASVCQHAPAVAPHGRSQKMRAQTISVSLPVCVVLEGKRLSSYLFSCHFPQVFLPQGYFPLQSPSYTSQLVGCWHAVLCEFSLTLLWHCAMLLPQTIFQPLAASQSPIREGERGRRGLSSCPNSLCLFCIATNGVEMCRGGLAEHPDLKTEEHPSARADWFTRAGLKTCPSACSLRGDAATALLVICAFRVEEGI